MGFVGYLVRFLRGLFSAGAAFLPVCLIVEALLWKNDMKHGRLKAKACIDAGFIASGRHFDAFGFDYLCAGSGKSVV